MAQVQCLDGSRLDVVPVPVVDRDGRPYEVTLRLLRDGERFGAVGERCGFFLAALHGRLERARSDDVVAEHWPDPDHRFPPSSLDAGLRAWAADSGHPPAQAAETLTGLARYLPRDRELFAFRCRDPDDVGGAGELRCALNDQSTWVPDEPAGPLSRGHWRLARTAVLDAWGDAGLGVRALLTSAQLLQWLDRFLAECRAVGATYPVDEDGALLRRPAG